MLSIIIPTLNEEKYLPLLLSSIKAQDFTDYEIIVADAGSKDKTIEIAKANSCQVVPGGLPAKARNNGSKFAKAPVLLFLDADAILPQDFLVKAINDFEKQNLDVATFPLFFIGQGFNKFASLVYNFWVVLTQPFLPHAFGAALLTKKSIYEKLGGFDEEIKLAEDHDFARRAKKIAKLGIIKNVKVFVSDRRFKEDGWVKTLIKYCFCELYMVFKGPVKNDIFNYKFNHYDKKDKKN